MKKRIGVMPLWDDEKQSIWMLPGYLDGLQQAGMEPVIFPLTEDEEELRDLVDLCDGILLTGGHDVNPALYGEAPVNASVVWNDTRDRMDSFVIRYALQKDLAMLGICRGIQILNVVLGGSLYQDLPTQYRPPAGEAAGKAVEHHMQAPYDRPCHTVQILPGTPLAALLCKDRLAVNSIHHQAIRKLAPVLRPMAISSDGLTEAVYMPTRKFVWGIQWHPEYWFRTNDDCREIFRCFAENL